MSLVKFLDEPKSLDQIIRMGKKLGMRGSKEDIVNDLIQLEAVGAIKVIYPKIGLSTCRGAKYQRTNRSRYSKQWYEQS